MRTLLMIAAGVAWAVTVAGAQAPSPPSSPQQVMRATGEVVQAQAGRLTLHTEKGEVQVDLPEGAKLLRVAPGSKDLKSATPITPREVRPGDRAAVLGTLAGDGVSIVASRIVFMSKSDISSFHEAEVRDWQARGLEGTVKALDLSKSEIVIAVPNRPPTSGNLTHPVTLTLTPKTVILHYSPDSAKFADAKPAPLSAVKLGDQLRVLGAKGEDGTQYAAEKVVFGTFRNIGATVISTDPAAGTLTVKNLATGKPVVVRAGADCRMHQLPDFLAQMIARLNSGGAGGGAPAGLPGGGPPGNGGGGAGTGYGGGAGGPGAGAGGPPGGFPGGGMRRGGMPNLSQALEHMPAITLNDLKRGEPVVIFSTEGSSPSQVTAIFILTGVEPILAAQPKGAEVNLGSWNLSLGGGEAEGAP